MKKIVSTFFLLIGLLGFAQIYPVQLTPIFNSPYSSKLADYTNTFEPKFQLLVNTTDFAITNRQVRLKLIVEGNGIKAESSDFVIAPAPIYINGGELMTLTNSDLGYLFKFENLQGINPLQYSSFLPEGMYSFCFEMYDMMTNQRISRSSCAYLYLMLNDPPFLNLPAKKEQIMATDFPNIFFSWTPRNGNVTNVSYHFEIKEILDPTIDPEYGFLMSPLLYEETLYTTAFVYDLGKPALLPGKRYAWRVKAISTGGLSENAVFKNDGYSEIYWFTYATNCSAPAFVLAQLQGSKSVKITWQGNNVMHNKYHLQYRKSNVADAEWFSTYTQNEQATINDLEANQDYEYRVGASCEPPTTESSYTYSGINHFETPAQGQKTDFSCGLNPAITISNQTPIKNLLVGETFTAGDFPIKILEISGALGSFSGKGYVTVPYLNDTKIAVAFENIKINTNYQLIDGVVETAYNENWANVQPIDPIIEEIFGPQTGEETPKSSEDSQDIADNGNNSENNNSTTQTGGDSNTDDTNTQTGNNTTVADNTTQTGNSQGATTGENTTQNSANNTNNGNNTGTKATENDYYIAYKGAKYYTGGMIKIPYQRNMNETFELGTLSDTTKVNFTIHQPGKQELWRGYTGDYKKTTIPIEDATLNNNLRVLDLLAEAYKTKGKPKVRIGIEKVVMPFTFAKLQAIDLSNKSRIAGAGETLYYINKPTVSKESKNTQFAITTNPTLDVNKIPKENIKWTFNSTAYNDNDGVLQFSKYVNENKDIKITATTGFSNSSSKSVNVKWVEEGYYKNTLSLESDNFKNPLIEKVFEATKMVNKATAFFDKIPFIKRVQNKGLLKSGGINYFYNIIAFQEEFKRQEDSKSRLYYEETKTTGGFELGIEGKATVWKWGLPFEDLPLPQWTIDKIKSVVTAEINIVASASSSGELKAVNIERLYAESTTKKTMENGVNPAILKLDIAFGVETEFSIGGDNDYLSGGLKGDGTAKAELFRIGYYNDGKGGKFDYIILHDGVYLELKASGYINTLGKKWETEKYYKKVQLIE